MFVVSGEILAQQWGTALDHLHMLGDFACAVNVNSQFYSAIEAEHRDAMASQALRKLID